MTEALFNRFARSGKRSKSVLNGLKRETVEPVARLSLFLEPTKAPSSFIARAHRAVANAHSFLRCSLRFFYVSGHRIELSVTHVPYDLRRFCT
jgi:hypothetical protein